jgi:CheY-like chemotaxis protein
MTRQVLLHEAKTEADKGYREPRDHSEVSRRPRPRARILIVDDEPLFGQTISLLLGIEHEVLVEHSGRGALGVLSNDADFDLVLCDLSLPDMNGPEIYARVSEQRPDLARRFVFVTGGAFTESTREFMERHDGFRLEKPFRISELERLLDLVCANSAISA